MSKVPLGGGRSTDGVVRLGDTVRRPQVFATQLLRDALVHLERVGFDAAPRWQTSNGMKSDTAARWAKYIRMRSGRE